MKERKKILALILSIAVALTLMPFTAFATIEEGTDPLVQKTELILADNGVYQGSTPWFTLDQGDVLKITYDGVVYAYEDDPDNEEGYWKADKEGAPPVRDVYCYPVNRDDAYRNVGDKVDYTVAYLLNGARYRSVFTTTILKSDGLFAKDGIYYQKNDDLKSAYAAAADFAKGHVDIPSTVVIGGEQLPVKWIDGLWRSKNITSATIPSTITEFMDERLGYYHDKATDSAIKIKGFIIYGEKGSAVEAYANKFKIEFREIGSQVPSVPAKISTITINAGVVNAGAIKSLIAASGGDPSGVKKIVLGARVKKIGKSAFKGFRSIKTIEIKTKKLKKASVKNALKGSSIKTIKVNLGSKKANKKYIKKYKKIFTKKNAGKKVKIR